MQFDIKNLKPNFSGAQADVYVIDNYALKVYKYENSKKTAFYEAAIQSIIEDIPFITPKIYEVIKTTNWTLVMDYIKGDSVYDLLDNGNMDLLDEIIKLQVKLNETYCHLPMSLKLKLQLNIQQTNILDNNIKSKVLNIVRNLSDDTKLCHGDFHVNNLIKTQDGIAIIDWSDACFGDSIADGCRTYMLCRLYFKQFAEYYLEKYCLYRNINKEDLLKRLPAIAASRFSDNNENEFPELMDMIKTHI